MSRRFTRLVLILMALNLAWVSSAWAWHVDEPLMSGQSGEGVASHGHEHDGNRVATCDHCCHASGHLVAVVAVDPNVAANRDAASLPVCLTRPHQTIPRPPENPPRV